MDKSTRELVKARLKTIYLISDKIEEFADKIKQMADDLDGNYELRNLSLYDLMDSLGIQKDSEEIKSFQKEHEKLPFDNEDGSQNEDRLYGYGRTHVINLINECALANNDAENSEV